MTRKIQILYAGTESLRTAFSLSAARSINLRLRLLHCIRTVVSASCLLFTAGCSTLVMSIDHKESSWENAELWRRMKDDPAVFHPKCLPAGTLISPKTGDWVVDPQDRAAFFVPKATCGGLTPAMWRAEAQKGVNKFSRGGQMARNGATALFLWPLLPLAYPPGLTFTP